MQKRPVCSKVAAPICGIAIAGDVLMKTTTHGDQPLKVPFIERLKGVPELIGIRVNDEPSYVELSQRGGVQVRRYDAMLLARVTVFGDHEHASERAFEKLAKYIYGANSEQATLPMTAPIYHEAGAESWTQSFVLPAGFNLANVPRPLDPAIQIVEVPPSTVAVLRYTGINDEGHRAKAASALRTWLATSGTKAVSDIRWAQYDPPFALPFLRRNEVQVDLVH
jgi:hypothetical protein